MTAIPLLSGIIGTEQAEFATSYPVNLEPVAVDNKLSRGQLRATSGAITRAEGPGIDRGGIEWRGQHYRVMGAMLVRIGQDWSVTEIGELGGEDQARLDYGFDRIGIRSGAELWYYDGSSLTQVTDEDLGVVADMVWFKSHWVTTDGNSIIVTELSDPMSILPLKYGSAEADPDPVVALLKLPNELYALGRHTITPFGYVGGNGFPMVPVESAIIPYGCVGRDAKCLFSNTFAFVGSARNEGLRVFIAGQGDASPISTRAVEDALAAVPDPSAIVMECRVSRGEQRLIVHLPDESWIYCAEASQAVQQSVWYRAGTNGPYRIRNAVSAYGRIIVGDPETPSLGELSDDTNMHFGEEPEWRFDCGLVQGPAILHSVELVGLPGRGGESIISLSLSRDGETFSQERQITVKTGQRTKRMQWRPGARFPNYVGLRFRGKGLPGFAKCEAVFG